MPDLGFNCRTERDKWRAGGIVPSERESRASPHSTAVALGGCKQQELYNNVLSIFTKGLLSCVPDCTPFNRS